MSPIMGITDRGERFPEIGKLRKGSPKGEHAPGKDLDYFRVVFDGQEVDAADKFKAIYGDKPQEINIFLAFDEIDRVWDAYLEAYTAGRMVARADGERFLYLVDTNTGEVLVKNGQPYKQYVDGQSVGTYFNEKKRKKEDIFCKPAGRLRVVIPELQRLAYLTFLTTSIHDIINISSQINALALINGGKIAGIPLVLRRRPKEISTPKADGSRARYSKWLVSVEASPQWVGAKIGSMQSLALPEGAVKYLPEPEPINNGAAHQETKPVQNDQAEEELPQDDFEDDDIEDGDFKEIPEAQPNANTPQQQPSLNLPDEKKYNYLATQVVDICRDLRGLDTQDAIAALVELLKANKISQNMTLDEFKKAIKK